MEKVKLGNLEPPLPWWISKLVTCPKCGAVGRLRIEDTDIINVKSERRLDGKQEITVPCFTPECDGIMSTQRLDYKAWI